MKKYKSKQKNSKRSYKRDKQSLATFSNIQRWEFARQATRKKRSVFDKIKDYIKKKTGDK